MSDEIETLRAEVADLRRAVAQLKAAQRDHCAHCPGGTSVQMARVIAALNATGARGRQASYYGRR